MKIYSKYVSIFAILAFVLCCFALPTFAGVCSSCRGSGVDPFGKTYVSTYGSDMKEYCKSSRT